MEIAGFLPADVYRPLGEPCGGPLRHRGGGTTRRARPELASGTGAPVGTGEVRGQLLARDAILLWLGGGIAFAAQLPELGVAIWIVNLINGFFSSWQEYKADRATEALRSLLPREVTVLRDGEPHRILAEALVPGDVVLLEEGDRVSADARFVEHTALRVDQSTLTGESRPVRKASEPCDATGRTRTDLTNVVFAGTSVAVGRGKAIATATGAATEFGRAAPERCVVVAVIRGGVLHAGHGDIRIDAGDEVLAVVHSEAAADLALLLDSPVHPA